MSETTCSPTRGPATPPRYLNGKEETSHATVWTGSNRLGYAWSYGDLRFFAGARERTWAGYSRSTTGGGIVYAPDEPGYLPPLNSNQAHLYGISPVITVQAPVWEATLTVDGLATAQLGCDNESSISNCSNAAVLTDDDFTHGGTTRTVASIYVQRGSLVLRIEGLTGAETKTALMGMTLSVNGRKYLINTSSETSTIIYWGSAPSWTNGQTVKLSLAAPVTVE